MRYGIDARLWEESGVGRYIRNLVKGFDEVKSENTFIVFLPEKIAGLVNFSSPNLQIVPTNAKWHSVEEQISFKKQLESYKLDLVHFPYFSFPGFYRGKYVITIHDLIIDHFQTGKASSLPLTAYHLKRLGYKFLIKRAVKNAEFIICPSNATKDEIIDHYNCLPDKIKVIYEGFDSLISENSVKESLVSKNYVLYVGNAYPHKNLPVLLQAYSILRQKLDIELVCIGRKDFFYEKLEREQHAGVHFLHSIDDSTLFEYYSNARFFVMPSLMEGFGLPILEAMSLSCPILSSNTPALKEIGGDAVIYFDPTSVNDLTDKMFLLLNSYKLPEELIDKGRERSREFSWDACVSKTLQIYESCNSV